MINSEEINFSYNFGGNAMMQLIAKQKGGDNLTLIFECHKNWRGFMLADNADAHFITFGFITMYWLRQSFMSMMKSLDCALEEVGCPKEDGEPGTIRRL